MRAHTLRHRITLEQPTAPQSATGQPTEAWTTLATVWAAIEPLTGREYFEAARVNAEVDHRIRIRYRDDVTAIMRVRYGTRIFDLRAVLNLEERDRELNLLAKERVA